MRPAVVSNMALLTFNGPLTSLGECSNLSAPPILEPLMTVYATEKPRWDIGDGGHGNRLFFSVTGGDFWGPKIQGRCCKQGVSSMS